MTDVNRLFSHLHQLSDAINRESDGLTEQIAAFEKRVVDLNLGVQFWHTAEPVREDSFEREGNIIETAVYLVLAKTASGWGLCLRSIARGDDPEEFFAEVRLRDAAREDRIRAVDLFPGFLEGLVDVAEKRLAAIKGGRISAERVNAQLN